MKVLHFSPAIRLDEGGVAKAVIEFCTMLQPLAEITLATFGEPQTPKEWSDQSDNSIKLKVLDGNPGHGKLNTQQLQQLKQLIENADVVHMHSIWFVSNAQVAKLCKAAKKPYIVSAHGMLDRWALKQRTLKKWIYLRTVSRNLFKDAAFIHCTAQDELNQSERWYRGTKGRVILLPLDLAEYTELPSPEIAYNAFDQLDRDLPKILFLSRIHYVKGIERLIKASAILHKQGIKHQLLIAGPAEEPYASTLKELSIEEGNDEIVRFLGFVSGKEKTALFNACQTFALASSHENFSFVLFESLASGTPVVTSKAVLTWSEIQSSGGGTIVDNTPEGIAEGLKAHLSDLEKSKRSGLAAREWVFSELDHGRIAQQYLDLYQEAIDSSHQDS